MKLQEITITKVTAEGSNQIRYNVACDGRPFGQIWTFKAKGERHPYHVTTLTGVYVRCDTYQQAETTIRGLM